MQRTSWSGGRPQSDAEEARTPLAPYSKSKKPRQGASRGSGRLTARLTAAVVGIASLGLILWGLSVQFGLYQRSNPGWQLSPEDRVDAYHKQLDALIQRTEAERQKAVEELQPAFQVWQELQTAAAGARQRLRESRADFSNLKELHDQRLNVLAAVKHDKEEVVEIGGREHSVKDLKGEWDEELSSAEDTVSKVSAEDRDVMYRESKARRVVEGLRRDIQAMGAALTEYMERRSDGSLAAARGARQPGNLFDRKLLLEVFSRDFEGPERRRLGNEEHGEEVQQVLGSLEQPLVNAAGPSLAKKTDKLDKIEQQGGLGEGSGSGGFEALQDGVMAAGETQKLQEESKTANIKRAGEGSTGALTGGSRAMLPESNGEEGVQKLGWLSNHWADRGNGILGEGEADNSIRCEVSGICEGSKTCPPGGAADNLGCVTDNSRRQEIVRAAAKWTWEGYKKYAFGHDELLPLSQSHETWFDLGLTLVDGLDTLLLLGLDSEYEEARKWVAEDLRLDPNKTVNLFETTIRVVGGLLSAFHLSNGDKVMLYKAASLALRLLPAFGSQTGIPFSDVNLRELTAKQPLWTQFSSLSEVTSLSLEYSFLARASGEKEPMQRALEVVHQVLQMPGQLDGLAPIYVDIQRGKLHGHVTTLGARGDSYYEYLLKQWLLSGKQDEKLLRGYEAAMRGMRKHMLMRTDQDGLLFVGELTSRMTLAAVTVAPQRSAKMDHLVCFLPGLLALGHHHGINTAAPGEPDDLEVAEELMRTCYELYRRTPTGLAPEIGFFVTTETTAALPIVSNDAGGGDFVIKPQDSHNLLRPETMESLFVLWRVTGKTHFQEWAWHIFRAFEQHTRVATGGYANLESCLQVPPPKRDKMESFWLAETLKYLFLILDDSNPQLVSLDEYVFNTEAHPMPVEGSLADISAGGSYEQVAYKGVTNVTLPARIKYWEDLAVAEAARRQVRAQ